MSRLTKKEKNRLSCHHFKECDYLRNGTPRIETLTKLGKLEDLEDDLGCLLDIVVKALKEGIIDDCGTFYKPIEISLGVTLYQGELLFVFKNFDQQEAVMCANLGLNYFPDSWLLKHHGSTWWVKGERNSDE